MRKGDNVALLARNTLNWALLDFALAQIGAVGIPVYASSSSRDVGYLLAHSEAVAIVCEDADQLAKVEAVSDELPALQHVITYHDLDGLAAHGRDHAASHPTALDDATAAVTEDDLFTIIYTSGTTGPPKGCMLSNRNYYEMASVVDRMPGYYRADDLMLLYLPLAHNYGRLMLLLGAKVGFTIAFLSDPLRVGEALPQVRPTLLPSVPRVYEKVYSSVQSRFDATTGARRRLIDWALGVGREVSSLEAQGAPVPAGLRAKRSIADRLVFTKVRAALGGRLRLPGSGGAPLAKEIAEFFDAVGVRITEGYGLTECTTACSVNVPDRYRFGSVGQPLPGFEIRIADDGEVEVRSETVFQGYYKDPEATAAVLGDDGWLKTGDIGEIDDDGFLHITDRKKDILVTAGGKNVAPQNIENDLKTSKYVSQALVLGDRRPYCSALLTLDAGGDRPLGRGERRRSRRSGAGRRPACPRAASARRRRHEPRSLSLRADQAVCRPPARLHHGGGRDHADAQAQAPSGPGALRGRDRGALRRAVRRGRGERRGRERGLEPAGADVRAVLGEARDPDDVARVRRVHELTAADVDPHVAEAAEEDEIAGRELVVRNRRSHAVLRRRVMRAGRRRPARRRSS